jgi:hypothetical protein
MANTSIVSRIVRQSTVPYNAPTPMTAALRVGLADIKDEKHLHRALVDTHSGSRTRKKLAKRGNPEAVRSR